MEQQTLLVGLAHPDDEVGVVGTILAQRARGDRVIIVWLTRGEMTAAFGNLSIEEVSQQRVEQGTEAARLLGVESRFLDLPDTRLAVTPEVVHQVAQLIAEIRPTGLLTWGDAWIRGMRHPDHQAAGQIFRDAIVLARIAAVVQPLDPHRVLVPVFTLRDFHSRLPAVAVNVEPFVDQILELGRFYHSQIGFGDSAWLSARLQQAGQEWGLSYAEVFDAWETQPGPVASLLPATPSGPAPHPERR